MRSKKAKKLIFTVTNDLNYDQRMIRICTSLSLAGYDVTLIGFKRKKSKELIARPYKQVRIPIIVESGKLLYIDYWLKLFFFLLFSKVDLLCAIDLDTILPVYFASVIRKRKRVYDAHELFTELKEVVSRPAIHSLWLKIEKFTLPKFPNGYTIGECYAEEFNRRYQVKYEVVRNATILQKIELQPTKDKVILYQGWVNEGRCFEQLIPAMQWVNAQLIVCGEGNYFAQSKALATQLNLNHKIIFKGFIPPSELLNYTRSAYIGITLFDATSLSNRLSMANRFFDYMHSCIPQVCNNYPEYEKVIKNFEVAALLSEVTSQTIATTLNKLLNDNALHTQLAQNCIKAREVYCWQEEEKKLLSFYQSIFSS